MVISGQLLIHYSHLKITLFVKASWTTHNANHLSFFKTEYICFWHSLWSMKSDCQDLLTHLPADRRWLIHTQTRVHWQTHSEYGNWTHEAKGREQQNLTSCLCVVFKCFKCVGVQVVFCVPVQMPWHALDLLNPGNFLWGHSSVTAAGT